MSNPNNNDFRENGETPLFEEPHPGPHALGVFSGNQTWNWNMVLTCLNVFLPPNIYPSRYHCFEVDLFILGDAGYFILLGMG